MDIQQLKDYLDSAVRLESAVLLHKYVADMSRKALKMVNMLHIDEAILNPQLYDKKAFFNEPEPLEPRAPKMISRTEMMTEAWKKSLIFSLWGFLPLLFLLKMLTDNTIIAFVLAYGLSFVCLLFIISQLDATRRNIKARRVYEEEKKKYEEALTSYQQRKKDMDRVHMLRIEEMTNECRRFNKMLPDIRQMAEGFSTHLKNWLHEVEKKQHALEAFLNSFLYNGPLEHSFCHIVAIAQLYDYLESGIAFDLSGSHGAYEVYMSDCRTHRIQNDVDQIMQQLRAYEDACKDEQERLYYALLEIANKERTFQTLFTAYVKLADWNFDRFAMLSAAASGKGITRQDYEKYPHIFEELKVVSDHAKNRSESMEMMEEHYKEKLIKDVKETCPDRIKRLQIELNGAVNSMLRLVKTYYVLYDCEEENNFLEIMRMYEH